ncbi:MAG: hypothetical protein IKU12_01305, partial [Oscillospiraceae bacterium]|nr:hypothetical protein [Oscillospiraceae bacterium]
TGGYTATAFGPNDYASREQTAAMLVRTLQKMKGGMGVAGVQREGGADSAVNVLLVSASLDLQRDGSYAFSETAAPEGKTTALYWAQVKSAEVLADPTAAAAAIAENAASYAGAAVSFDNMSAEHTESYTALVAALRQALAGKMLYAFTQAPGWGESSLYDYAALAPLCDRIVVQVAAHEDTEGAIPMCPATPLEEVYHAVMLLKEAGGAGKMMLYITTDADVWYSYTTSYRKGESVTAAEIKKLLEGNAESYYSTRYASAYLTVPNGAGHKVVWYENAASVASKTQLLRMMGVNAVCYDSTAAFGAGGGLIIS